jgi:uncharacterized protein YciI
MDKRHFMYVLEPLGFTAPEEMTDAQRRIAAAHFDYLKRLSASDVVVLAGRTEGAEMGIAVLETDDEEAARGIMENDPAVKHGLMRATLYPYRLALLRGTTPPEG